MNLPPADAESPRQNRNPCQARSQPKPLHDDFDTLNGFLVSLMEKIPNDGETARLQAYGYEFSIRKVKDKMIREVLVKKADAKHQRPEDDPLARNGKE